MVFEWLYGKGICRLGSWGVGMKSREERSLGIGLIWREGGWYRSKGELCVLIGIVFMNCFVIGFC